MSRFLAPTCLAIALAGAALAAPAGAGTSGTPFGPVAPLGRAELAGVRGGFEIGGFEMNIGVRVRTGLDDRLLLTSNFVLDGLRQLRRTASALVPATQARPEEIDAPGADIGADIGADGGRVPAPTSAPAPTVLPRDGVRPAAAEPAPAPPAPAPRSASVSIPGLTIDQAVNGLPRTVILNRLNNVSISQAVQIDVTVQNFRGVIGRFNAGRLAAQARRAALALGRF